MKTEFLSLTPALWDACEKAFINCNERNSCCFFSLESFQQIPSISIDYAIMEKSSNLCVLLSHFGWSDLGEWEAVSRHHAPDSSGNTWAGDGEHFYLDTSNTHIHASGHDKKLVASIGIKDLVVVNTPDVLMIADKSEAHRVKELVECLKGQERTSEITRIGTTVYRPWGQYTTMTTGPNHLIKRITVAPGQKLSLQLHHHRSEHWVVVKGKALVQVGSKKQHSGEGAYHFIPKGETHRLTNIGVDLLHLVEIQFGEHLDEDDIVRLADEYGRSSVD